MAFWHNAKTTIATMTDPHSLLDTELVEHNGYQLRLGPSGPEWLAFVPPPKQRPTLILAPNREAALARAYECIEAQRTSERNAP
jgi:hypothetical protein